MELTLRIIATVLLTMFCVVSVVLYIHEVVSSKDEHDTELAKGMKLLFIYFGVLTYISTFVIVVLWVI